MRMFSCVRRAALLRRSFAHRAVAALVGASFGRRRSSLFAGLRSFDPRFPVGHRQPGAVPVAFCRQLFAAALKTVFDSVGSAADSVDPASAGSAAVADSVADSAVDFVAVGPGIRCFGFAAFVVPLFLAARLTRSALRHQETFGDRSGPLAWPSVFVRRHRTARRDGNNPPRTERSATQEAAAD